MPIKQLQPELPSREPQLLLSTDHSLIKGSPILTQWYPSSANGEDGVLEIVNIELLSGMLLEPQPPQITHASLTIGKRHLLYGQGVVDKLPESDGEQRYQLSSQHFPLPSALADQSQRTGVKTPAHPVTVSGHAQLISGVSGTAGDR